MRRDRPSQISQAVASALCAVLVWGYTSHLEGTEFSGGRITRPLLEMAEFAMLLFVIALPVSFLQTRLSGVINLVASLLAMPLYFYFVAPGPFRRIFKGEYSVAVSSNFVWDRRSLAGIFALVLACCLSVRKLRFRQSTKF